MAEDVWKQLERMRLELTDNTHIQRPLLEAMIDQHKAVEAARHAALDYIRDLEERNDALAAHVEMVQETLDHDFTTDAARVRRLREVMGKGAKASLASHDFSLRIEFAQKHRAELARLKAEWQAEALTSVIEEAPLIHSDMLLWIDERIRTLHAQSQETTHD